MLKLSFLAMAMAGYLSLPEPQPEASSAAQELRAKGWEERDGLYCEPLLAGRFYEISSEESSVEAYVSESGRVLTSTPRIPEPPYDCREIPHPTHIKEIP